MKLSLLRASKEEDEGRTVAPVDRDWHAVYNRHIHTVYRVCYSLTGNRPDAEDAAQAVFMKLIEQRNMHFKDIEHEKAWLIVTAQNHCRDMHRRWWKRKVVHLDPSVLESTAAASSAWDNRVGEQLQRLPAASRLLLYLHYYEGYKLAEIADMLQVNLNTIKTRMRAAKKRLKWEIDTELNMQMEEETYETQ